MVEFGTPEHTADGWLDCGLGHACSFCPQEPTCTLDKPKHNKRLTERRLDQIGHVIMVLANKGGVGKSTVAANLAAALAGEGFRVGLGDADVHGPNAAKFFGSQGHRVRVRENGIGPNIYRHRDNVVKVGSLAYFLRDDDAPVVWRDAYKFDFVHHLVGSFDWGALDFWVIDMPPGTGNELITMCDILEGSNLNAVLVTTPQSVALLDSMKAARFCKERGVPILGVVKNMAGMVCPHCDGAIEIFPTADFDAALAGAGLDVLAEIPLSPALAIGSDAGQPIVDQAPNSVEAKAFRNLARRCIELAKAEARAVGGRELEQNLRLPEDLAEIGENLPPDLAAAGDDALRGEIEDLVARERERVRSLK